MPVVRLEHAGQLIIPNEVREILGWEEGDYFDIALKEEVVILKKAEMIPESEEDDESWFLSDDWQERHHKSLKDIAEGRIYGPFEKAEDLLKSLKSSVMYFDYTENFKVDYQHLPRDIPKTNG